MTRTRRWTGRAGLAVLLLGLFSGCASGSTDRTPVPALTTTPAPVPWQRPAAPITGDDFARVHLTGRMAQHQQTVNSVAFAASGTRLASVGADRHAVMWNLANGEPLVERGDSDGRAIFFGPDENTVITVNRDGFTRVYAVILAPPGELRELTSFAGSSSSAGALAQSPDRTLLAFGAESGAIHLWRVPEGESVLEIQAHPRAIQQLVFSPDGTRLASISLDLGVSVWSVPGGERVADLTSTAQPPLTPQRAAFSPDGTRLAVANATGIGLWDLTTGQPQTFIDTAASAAASALAFSPDGRLLVGCGPQPVVGLWDAAGGEFLGGLPLPGLACANAAFSPDGRLLLTLPSPGTDVYLWDITHITDAVPAEQKLLNRRDRQNMGLYPGARFYDAAWSPDGRLIVLLDELGPLYVLSAAP